MGDGAMAAADDTVLWFFFFYYSSFFFFSDQVLSASEAKQAYDMALRLGLYQISMGRKQAEPKRYRYEILILGR